MQEDSLTNKKGNQDMKKTRPSSPNMISKPPPDSQPSSSGISSLPPVLDVCCGPRGMWFNKRNPLAIYTDRRHETIEMSYPSGNYREEIHPDIVADFTDLPFPDNSFALVVMDPPHITQCADTGRIVKRYGRLTGEWRDMLAQGFAECIRVLRPEGTLIFKWNECRIPVKEIIPLCPVAPLFGHQSGKTMQTHWIAFFKPLIAAEKADEKPEGQAENA